MESKQCSKCKKTKALSEFNTDPRVKDGLRADCKACQYKVQSRRYWAEHHKPEAKEAARTAHKQGKLQKPLFCEQCGKDRPLDRHHPDYKKPLKIVWLCRKCHSALKSA